MDRPSLRRAVGALALLSFCVACSSPSDDSGGSGGAGTSGGASALGGATSGGSSLGGSSSGGVTASGGFAAFGGTPASGGATSGGATSAGAASGGATSGGASSTGGSAGALATSGGSNSGGTSSAGGRGGATNSGGNNSGGASSTGGSGGGTGFDPCPATGACKVMPLGDSITDGFGTPGGYRIELFKKAVDDNKQLTFVGRAMNGPTSVAGTTFPKNHEGYSGWLISQIDGIVPSPALDVSPHIVLLHIGTNDMARTPSGAVERLNTLVDQILTKLPNSLLVVATIIPLPGNSTLASYNAAIPGIVKTRADAGKHIVLVDQFKGFLTSELADGVHPNPTGYARMASAWYTAIGPYLH